jgi:hypothetical protein
VVHGCPSFNRSNPGTAIRSVLQIGGGYACMSPLPLLTSAIFYTIMAKLLEIIPINHIYLERQLPRHENANAE